MAAAKMDEDDKERKHLAEESTSTLASLKNGTEKALKLATVVMKTPNAEAMKSLMKLMEELLGDADELKKLMKDMKAVSK